MEFFKGVKFSLITSAIMYLVLFFLLMLTLSACGLTPQGDAIREYVKETGATVADNALENAEWVICYAATVGSVKRRYGTSPESMAVYNEFCRAKDADISLITYPPNPP